MGASGVFQNIRSFGHILNEFYAQLMISDMNQNWRHDKYMDVDSKKWNVKSY